MEASYQEWLTKRRLTKMLILISTILEVTEVITIAQNPLMVMICMDNTDLPPPMVGAKTAMDVIGRLPMAKVKGTMEGLQPTAMATTLVVAGILTHHTVRALPSGAVPTDREVVITAKLTLMAGAQGPTAIPSTAPQERSASLTHATTAQVRVPSTRSSLATRAGTRSLARVSWSPSTSRRTPIKRR